MLSIGDGPNDGAAGENDDIRGDVEVLAGGSRNDVLIGTAGREPADRVRRPARPAEDGFRTLTSGTSVIGCLPA